MQTFAYEYPEDVIGMVLDDSVHADETIRFGARFATPVWEKAVLRIGVRLGAARLFGWCDQSGACPDCVKFTDTLMDQFATYPQRPGWSLRKGVPGTPGRGTLTPISDPLKLSLQSTYYSKCRPGAFGSLS